jgi:carboxyl-terminal processing protease
MPQRNLLLLIVATVASYVCYAQGQQNPYGRYLTEGLATIDANALDPAPDKELFAGAMGGMIEVLRERGDQHSQFFDEAEADRLRNEIHQQVGGIGVRIGIAGDPPRPVIAGPIAPESPAGRAKLQPGDRILDIDGKPTADLERNDILAMLTGDSGTTLRLAIEPKGETKLRTVELVRGLVPTDSVVGDRRDSDGHWIFTLESDPRIALVRIVSFGDRTSQELAEVLRKLEKAGVQGVVLDLRDNAGGALGAAVAVCEMLLPAGKTIVETRGRGQTLRQSYATTTDGEFRNLPLAVIVNRQSASAAEIVAACLQDHGRAVVVGERSFGKGTVQQMLPLGKSLLKLTWAGFSRPSGANIHRAHGAPASAVWGVTPNTGLDAKFTTQEYRMYRDDRRRRDDSDLIPDADGEPFQDRQLELAVEALKQPLDGKL